MREIKFRAWDIKNKKWIQVGQSLLGYLVAWKSDTRFEVLGRGDYKITQYTGLKDKNGVEIYEGDIVRVKDYYDNIYFKGIVEFDNASFNINQFGAMYHYRWIDYECEVIGNIWGNPELLEEINAK